MRLPCPVQFIALTALSETVAGGVSERLIPGYSNTDGFGRQFVEAVVGLMNNDEAWQCLSQGARHRTELHCVFQ